MKSLKWFRLLCSVMLTLMLLSVLPSLVLADDTTTPGETMTPLQATSPVVSLDIVPNTTHVNIVSGATATITMNVTYTNTNEGAAGKAFDVLVTQPSNWTNTVTNSAGQNISNITLVPGAPNILTLTITPPSTPLPDAGDYPLNFAVSSPDLKASVDVTVTVTAKYGLTFLPEAVSGTTPMYNTKVVAGKTVVFSVTLTNTGTAAVSNVALSSDKPTSWSIDFPQSLISSFATGATQNIDVKITPPAGTLAGDYLITLSAKGTEVSATDLQIRVTVETSTVWSWIGVIIIVIVIAVITFLFVRFSRR